jgi:hypothetical protein
MDCSRELGVQQFVRTTRRSLQQVLGFAPLAAGLAYLPLFIISHFVPRLSTRCLVGFALLDGNSSYFPGVLVPILIHAVGIALVFAPGSVAIMEGVPDEQAGTASGLLQMDQQVGGALGIAIIAAVYAGGAVEGQFTAGRGTAFAVASALSLLAAIVALRMVRSVR